LSLVTRAAEFSGVLRSTSLSRIRGVEPSEWLIIVFGMMQSETWAAAAILAALVWLPAVLAQVPNPPPTTDPNSLLACLD